MVLLLALGVGLFFYVYGVIGQVLIEIQVVAGKQPDLALKMAGRLLLWLVFLSGSISVAIGGYLCVLILRVRRSGIYPPPGMPVAFKTRIKKDGEAEKMGKACLLMAAVLFLQPLFGLYIWYTVTGGAW
ncbi:MAG: hypothetical protein OQK12_00585 [Motiliproteus sp.]|nr:hypothetical protein [Motiliproteus sp.]MCW9053315.1 hypothetical protein [Motiliproteus sp.]